MRRISLLSVLVLIGCTPYYQQKNVANPCPHPNPNGDPPIVCIDSGLNPDRNPVHVHHGQFVHFFISGNDDIEITSDALESPGHDHGHAWGHVRDDKPKGEYKYTIKDLTTGRTNDPEIMIDY